MKIFAILTVLLVFDSAFANSTELSLEQNALQLLHTNFTILVSKAVQNVTELMHAGHGHLLSALTFQIGEIKSALDHVKSKLDHKPFHYPMYMVEAVMGDVTFLDGQIDVEVEIVNTILAKNWTSQPLTREKLIDSTEKLIKNARDFAVKHANSREYFLIENEILNLEKILNNLHNKNETSNELHKIEQSLSRHQMSLQVQENQANWRLPCQVCLPGPSSSLLLITEPHQKLHLLENYQNLHTAFAIILNSSEHELTRLNQSGHAHLAFALEYQTSLQKMFLNNLEKLLVSKDQVYPQYYFIVQAEDMIRLTFRSNVESDIVKDVIRNFVPKNETTAVLLARTNILINLCTEFATKHPHATEWAEIEVEVRHLEALKQTLGQIKTEDKVFNLKVEQQLDRQQQTLMRLMDQATWRFN